MKKHNEKYCMATIFYLKKSYNNNANSGKFSIELFSFSDRKNCSISNFNGASSGIQRASGQSQVPIKPWYRRTSSQETQESINKIIFAEGQLSANEIRSKLKIRAIRDMRIEFSYQRKFVSIRALCGLGFIDSSSRYCKSARSLFLLS